MQKFCEHSYDFLLMLLAGGSIGQIVIYQNGLVFAISGHVVPPHLIISDFRST